MSKSYYGAIELLRKDSDVPNITQDDDYRAFKFATKGMTGVVKGYKNECDYEIESTENGDIFRVKSGEIILNGQQFELLAGEIELDYTRGDFWQFGIQIKTEGPPFINIFGYDEDHSFILDEEDRYNNQTNGDKKSFYLYVVQFENKRVKAVYKGFNLIDGNTAGRSLADASGNEIEKSYVKIKDLFTPVGKISITTEYVIPVKQTLSIGMDAKMEITQYVEEFLELAKKANPDAVKNKKITAEIYCAQNTTYPEISKIYCQLSDDHRVLIDCNGDYMSMYQYFLHAGFQRIIENFQSRYFIYTYGYSEYHYAYLNNQYTHEYRNFPDAIYIEKICLKLED